MSSASYRFQNERLSQGGSNERYQEPNMMINDQLSTKDYATTNVDQYSSLDSPTSKITPEVNLKPSLIRIQQVPEVYDK